MCFLSNKAAKFLDPGGLLVEQIAPKDLKPLTGLHGTVAEINKPAPPGKPLDYSLFPGGVKPGTEPTAATPAAQQPSDPFSGSGNLSAVFTRGMAKPQRAPQPKQAEQTNDPFQSGYGRVVR